MTSSSTSRTTGRELSPASLAIAFAAGFLAVLTFYEALFLLLYVGGVIPVPPFSMKPMPPIGVPEVLSQSFWGGVWGMVFLLIVPRFFSGTGYWVASAVIGGIALTLVYMFVVVPLKTGALPPNVVGLFARLPPGRLRPLPKLGSARQGGITSDNLPLSEPTVPLILTEALSHR